MANSNHTATAPMRGPPYRRRRDPVRPPVRASRPSPAGWAGPVAVVVLGVVALMICVIAVPPPDGSQGPVRRRSDLVLSLDQSPPEPMPADTFEILVLSTRSGPLATVVPPPTL